MTSLIRLYTDNEDGIFDSKFRTDINVNEYSEMALHNMTLDTKIKDITIDASNNNFEYQMGTGNIKKITLPTGTYNSSNFNTFLDGMTTAMNKKLVYQNNEAGSEFKVEVNQKDKINIELRKCLVKKFYDGSRDNTIYGDNVGITSSSIWKNGGVDNTFDSYAYSKLALPLGCGNFYFKIRNVPAPDGPNKDNRIIYYIGLCSTDPSTITTLNLSNIKYGVELSYQASNASLQYYQLIEDGVVISTVDFPNDPSVDNGVTFQISDGSVSVNEYNFNTKNYSPYKSYNYDNTTKLYPIIFFYKQDGIPIEGFCLDSKRTGCHQDQFTTLSTPDGDSELGTTPTSGNIDGFGPVQYEFQSEEVAKFFGYESLISPLMTVYEGKLSYTAVQKYGTVYVPESLVVELLNIDVDSYDSYSGNKKSILATVTNPVSILGRVVYNASYPLFIRLNNARKLNFRNIQARILDEEMNPITINGVSTITLLVKNGS
ncbi:TPA_asm: penton+ [Monosiga MELD virus 2]|nr:TPA_asm: penton+ [Monosiga MELD virus 2]